MYWADKLSSEIKLGAKHRVDDMKTPSGHAHAGSIRTIGTHGLLYEAMKKAGHTVDFTYVINDVDPMDGLPVYLDPEVYKSHMGKPLYTIPAPDGTSENYAKQFALEHINAFNKLGFNPEIYWSSELYAAGKIDSYIRLCLDNVEKVRAIYKRVANQEKPEGWYPFQVICPNCGKVGCSLVTDWDGEVVTYECKVDLVEWAKGCGHKGKISPFGGTGKLMWKLDWAAHWAVLGITVEGAGKDHFSKGGSRYVAADIMTEIFELEPPFGFLHEFLLIGGAKMSSSKGNAMSSKDYSDVLPPELGRFLIVRTPYQRAINFDPYISDVIPDLFDEYDRCLETYYKTGTAEDAGRYYEAAQIKPVSDKKPFLGRFRQIATLMQMPSVDIASHYASEKGSPLTKDESELLNERIYYAKLWLEKFADDSAKFQFSESIPDLVASFNQNQKDFVLMLSGILTNEKFANAELLQQKIFETAKASPIGSKGGFQTIYQSLLGKDHGPKAGWLIFEKMKSDPGFVENRLRESGSGVSAPTAQKFQFDLLNEPNVITIAPGLKQKWPSIAVGYAEIHGVKIIKSDPALEELKAKAVEELKQIGRDDINSFPEVLSYRKLYKETGVDWHSRRPSPEALLRRLTQGKDLYTVNTCVDAYNLIVMKHRVSVGAFDLDKIKFPVELRQAQGGESIRLLGDDEATILKPGEICYFDSEGAYNLDFNYRDSTRTMVTTETVNLMINIDAVYDIDRTSLERSLTETISIITRFCGGEVTRSGVII